MSDDHDHKNMMALTSMMGTSLNSSSSPETMEKMMLAFAVVKITFRFVARP